MSTIEGRRGSELLVELAAAGELPEAERRRVLLDALAREGADPVAALERDAAATLARHPPDRVAAEVARRAAARPRPRSRWRLPVAALAACAVALVAAAVLPRRGAGPGPEDARDGVRVKGVAPSPSDPHLVVHRRTPGGAERVAPGTTLRAGDLVQLGYVAGGRPYGAIVSVDGAGGVTRHWPVGGTMAASLESGREVLLPESFRLDAAPRFERFILVTSERPFELGQVLEAVRALAAQPDATAPLRLPSGLAEADVVLAKESP